MMTCHIPSCYIPPLCAGAALFFILHIGTLVTLHHGFSVLDTRLQCLGKLMIRIKIGIDALSEQHVRRNLQDNDPPTYQEAIILNEIRNTENNDVN